LETIFNLQKHIGKRVLIFAGILIAAAYILGQASFALGLLFGALLALLNFRLLALSLQKAVALEPSRATIYAFSRYLLRFFLVGVAVLVAIKNPAVNVWGTFIGLGLVKVVILGENLFKRFLRIP
jgi:hypothetical protein